MLLSTPKLLKNIARATRLSSSGAYIRGESKPPTAVVMMNMGGPRTVDEVGPFLHRLFNDREIIQLPFQDFMGPFIAKRRTPKVQKIYSDIGGGSPIFKWTTLQGQGMEKLLDEMSPETAPHKHYVAFRYAHPLTPETLQEMKKDGVKRAIAFTQYPQWSCTTTGASLNELWRVLKSTGMENEFSWSVIDRWPAHDGFVDAVAGKVSKALDKFAPEDRHKAVIIFSAHSLPMYVVNRGDAYPQEVGATVHAVMQKLKFSNQYMLSWQSQVGPLPWLGPQTDTVLQNLGRRGEEHALVVPIAFTNDHVETLAEIDLQFAETAKKAGIKHFHRAESLNDDPTLIRALADIVATHIKTTALGDAHQHDHHWMDRQHSKQFTHRCHGCTNPDCRNILNPVHPYVQPKH